MVATAGRCLKPWSEGAEALVLVVRASLRPLRGTPWAPGKSAVGSRVRSRAFQHVLASSFVASPPQLNRAGQAVLSVPTS